MKALPLLIATVAVVVLAACGGGAGASDGASAPSSIAITGNDALEFDSESLTAAAGTVTVELTSTGEVEHTFVIEELDNSEVVAVDGGESATGTVDLEPGTYTFFCNIPAHRGAGMEGTLTVS